MRGWDLWWADGAPWGGLLDPVRRVHWSPRAAIDYPKLGGFKQEKCMLSWFWRPEVQSQGVLAALFPLKIEEKDLPQVSPSC